MNSKERAKPFIAARKQHLKEAAEDYTELVYDLIERFGEARTCEIAKHLGVSHVTAIRVIGRLQQEGYLTTSSHKPVLLTEKGKKLAQFSKKRHKILLDFLLGLGIPKKTAEIDVEGMEHHVSSETLEAIQKHLAALYPSP